MAWAEKSTTKGNTPQFVPMPLPAALSGRTNPGAEGHLGGTSCQELAAADTCRGRAAVSTRRTRGPRPTSRQAAASSSAVKSPSGPPQPLRLRPS